MLDSAKTGTFTRPLCTRFGCEIRKAAPSSGTLTSSVMGFRMCQVPVFRDFSAKPSQSTGCWPMTHHSPGSPFDTLVLLEAGGRRAATPSAPSPWASTSATTQGTATEITPAVATGVLVRFVSSLVPGQLLIFQRMDCSLLSFGGRRWRAIHFQQPSMFSATW